MSTTHIGWFWGVRTNLMVVRVCQDNSKNGSTHFLLLPIVLMWLAQHPRDWETVTCRILTFTYANVHGSLTFIVAFILIGERLYISTRGTSQCYPYVPYGTHGRDGQWYACESVSTHSTFQGHPYVPWYTWMGQTVVCMWECEYTWYIPGPSLCTMVHMDEMDSGMDMRVWYIRLTSLCMNRESQRIKWTSVRNRESQCTSGHL